MIKKSNNNIIENNLKYTKNLFNKIKNENTSNSIKAINNNKNNESVEKNNIDNDVDKDIILDSKDILAIKMLIKYLNNK